MNNLYIVYILHLLSGFFILDRTKARPAPLEVLVISDNPEIIEFPQVNGAQREDLDVKVP